MKWAKCNIGATSEEEAGLFFQWGDTQGYTAEQIGNGEGLKAFDLATYKFLIDGAEWKGYLKYNASDSKTVLDPEDDAAHVNMGGNWRMPTIDEFKELCLNTDVYLVQTDDKEIHGTKKNDYYSGYFIQWDEEPTLSTFKGIKLYKKDDKQTYLFVPVGGRAKQGAVGGMDYSGGLWSASRNSESPSYIGMAQGLSFARGMASFVDFGRREGVPVRGVLAQ